MFATCYHVQVRSKRITLYFAMAVRTVGKMINNVSGGGHGLVISKWLKHVKFMSPSNRIRVNYI